MVENAFLVQTCVGSVDRNVPNLYACQFPAIFILTMSVITMEKLDCDLLHPCQK